MLLPPYTSLLCAAYQETSATTVESSRVLAMKMKVAQRHVSRNTTVCIVPLVNAEMQLKVDMYGRSNDI